MHSPHGFGSHFVKHIKKRDSSHRVERSKFHQTCRRRAVEQHRAPQKQLPGLEKVVNWYFNFRRDTCQVERNVNLCKELRESDPKMPRQAYSDTIGLVRYVHERGPDAFAVCSVVDGVVNLSQTPWFQQAMRSYLK